jgi:23S rRNA (pseudouridine1915-N3)-methyltransferase
MQIKLIAVGKTDQRAVQDLVAEYEKRLGHYINFQFDIVTDLKNSKNLSEILQKEKEGELVLKKLQNQDVVFLLDEKGKQMTSLEVADFIQKKMNAGIKTLVFIIGGPYGFSSALYQRAQGLISLSKLTFSHQMIRVFFTEQLYRAFTILNNEPYHHE